jgi:hypothetical protein
MMRRYLGTELAVLAIVCTLGIFFFPTLSGPYPSVHGPVTALRAMRAWLLLLIALTLASISLASLVATRLAVAAAVSHPLQSDASQRSSVLRC